MIRPPTNNLTGSLLENDDFSRARQFPLVVSLHHYADPAVTTYIVHARQLCLRLSPFQMDDDYFSFVREYRKVPLIREA